jgi:hypothetical protein
VAQSQLTTGRRLRHGQAERQRGADHRARDNCDNAYFQQVKARLGGQLALLSMARKLARRCHHTLRNLDDRVLAPAA